MNKRTLLVLLTLAVVLVPGTYAQIQEPGFQSPDVSKKAQTGFKFLSLSLDPRASAMGDAMTAMDLGSSTGMLYNPATMASMQSNIDVAIAQTQWIADITYNVGTAAFRPMGGRYGVFGVSVAAVDYGSIEGSVIDAGSPDGYAMTGQSISPTAFVAGVGYARQLSDRFSIGANARYAYTDVGDVAIGVDDAGAYETKSYSKGTAVLDFGMFYRTGFRSLNFAASVRNFSRELKYEQDNFELPLTFQVGLSMNMMDITGMDRSTHSLMIAVDAQRPRDYSETVKFGAEYTLMNTLSLRAGYSYPTDIQGASLGAGLHHEIGSLRVAVDYAYTSMDTFSNVNRLGLQLSF